MRVNTVGFRNVALRVDGKCVNGGQVEISDDKWHELGGSFRIEKKSTKIMVYGRGPDAGVDLMVAGLQIFAVNRCARFEHLKHRAEKIRKRDVTLKFTVSNSETLSGTLVKIRQTRNSFSCVNRRNIDNEGFVDFFTNNFNRAVFDKYIQHILDLQEQGAPVVGIGIQGHVDSPVGPIVRFSLDKLAALRLPIWFMELSVLSDDEHVRAEDLEVMLREAFAHPAVDGVMSTDNALLVNAEGEFNEAGKRYVALMHEWLSCARGYLDDRDQYEFRGFHGSYEVEVVGFFPEKVTKTFVVDPGEDSLVISINL